MSFGWSAGDIATAVTFVYHLVQALDSCDGAAGDYREAVSFLRDLKRTLEPLQTFTVWNAYPAYGEDIGQQVRYIKEPVEQFLAKVLKYEPSLGVGALEGHHRHVLRKLQWYVFMSKKVLSLKNKIEAHMRVIDSLMQRLTLDVVWTTQQNLPENLRSTFQETIRPELISILREHLPPLKSALLEGYQEIQTTSHDALDIRLSELIGGLSLGIVEIKQQIKSSKVIQERIESCILGDVPRTRQKALLGAQGGQLDFDGGSEVSDQNSSQTTCRANAITLRDSLGEVYYLVFLYLGHFLKNLFLVLSRMVQPSRALMPNLLAKHNISFLDAIGRAPRVLPYEYFRSFKVLQAFIEHEFRDLPGSTWVDRGRYLVLSLTNNQVLSERNWGGSVVPGSTVAMSMLLQQRLNPSSNLNEQHCPERTCTGTWPRSQNQSWATCPVCQKEVFNSISSVSVLKQDVSGHSDSVDDSSFGPRPAKNEPKSQHSTATYFEAGLDEDFYLGDDISIFKRIVQRFESEISRPPVERLTPVQSGTPLSLNKFPNFLRAFYPFNPTQVVTDPAAVHVSATKGEVFLVHSVHTNGWADTTSLVSGARGWLPSNYCNECRPEEMRALQHAVLEIWDWLRSNCSHQQLDNCVSQSPSKIIHGVRSLLTHTNCLSRKSIVVQSHPGIQRRRNRMLSLLASFM